MSSPRHTLFGAGGENRRSSMFVGHPQRVPGVRSCPLKHRLGRVGMPSPRHEPLHIAQPNAIASVPQLAVHASRAEARWNSAWIASISTTACSSLGRVESGCRRAFPGMPAAEATGSTAHMSAYGCRPALKPKRSDHFYQSDTWAFLHGRCISGNDLGKT